MIDLAAALTVLALQAAPAAATCEVTDNACKAQQYIVRARAVKNPQQRALLLHTAHRSLLASFAETGKPRDLCRARAAFDDSLAVRGQGEEQRASFERARGELEAVEKRHAVRCAKTSRPRKQDDAATTPATTTNAPTIPEPPESNSVPAPGLVAPTPRLAEGPFVVHPADPQPAATSDASPPEPGAKPRRLPPGHGFYIAGGTTLGVGVVAVGVAIYAGAEVAGLTHQIREFYDFSGGEGTDSTQLIDARLREERGRWVPVAAGATIAATMAVIVGAVLVHLGVRRAKASSPRTSLVPAPGGLAIHARF